MIDTNSQLRRWLIANAATLTGLVGTDIYWPRLPEGFTIAQALSFSSRSGTVDPGVPFIVPSYQMKCWGTTPEDARQVYRALYDDLHGVVNQTIGTHKMRYAWQEGEGQDLQDPDAHPDEWFFVLAF